MLLYLLVSSLWSFIEENNLKYVAQRILLVVSYNNIKKRNGPAAQVLVVLLGEIAKKSGFCFSGGLGSHQVLFENLVGVQQTDQKSNSQTVH